MSATWNTIVPPKCIIESIEVPPEFQEDPVDWLTRQAQDHDLQWVLVHAYDGVIWGELRGDVIHWSTPFVGPVLRAKTLLNVRLFGPPGELFLWRSGKEWRSRLLRDDEHGTAGEDYYDETHLLWGDHACGGDDGFVLLREGTEGLCHALPIPSEEFSPRAALLVRHYFGYDGDDQAFIALSRLVSLTTTDLEGL